MVNNSSMVNRGKTSDGIPTPNAFDGSCDGLTPVLEAVDELPQQGMPIPSSAQSRVKQFFVQQISCTPAAASRSSVTGSAIVPCPSSTQRPVRPKNISDLQQLQAELQNQAKRWKLSQCRALSPNVAAAVHLVTDAAAQAARQQIIEKNSPAYTVLLDEGYRAGVMAQGCAALKAALGVRVITHVQLARVLVIVQKTISVYMTAGDPASSPIAGCQYAWQQLRAFYSRDSSSGNSGGGSSSDSPAWDLPPGDVCALLFTFNQVTSTCLDPELVPCTVEYVLVPVPASLQQQLSRAFEGSVVGSFMMTGEGPAAQLAPFLGALPSSSSSSSNGSASGSSRGGTSSKAGTPFSSKAAISGPTAKAASHNGGSTTGAQAASSSAAAAATNSAKASSSSSSSNFASGKVVRVGCVPVGYANSMDDPLDDCSLLTPFCSGFSTVLTETAGWVAGGMADASRLRATMKQFLLDRLSEAGHATGGSAASAKSKASSSSSRNGGAGAASSGTVRRSVVPRQLPGLLGTLPEMEQFLSLLVAQLWPDATTAAAIPALVVSAAKEVAREQVIERKSAASNALHANLYSAAVVAAGMAVLKQKVQVTIRTAAQLQLVLIACCEALVSIEFEADHTAPSVRHEVAHSLYRTLQLIAASPTGTGGTAVSRKAPPCSLDVAYQVVHGIMTSTVHMLECSGEMTQAKVDAFYGHLSDTLLNSSPAQLFDMIAGTECPAMPPSAAAASGAAASQDSTWGKGHALAGLKGFFQKPAPDKPVTVKASSKGAVVASTAKQAASAAAPGKPAQKAAAAAAARSSGAGSAAGGGKGSPAATPPELLVEANLLKWYCSPEGLEHKVVVPLPQDSLALLTKLQQSTLVNRHGWNALHFACAAHRYGLAKQLLQAGAPVSTPAARLGLQPLHLACLGKLWDAAQFNKLVATAGAVGAFEKYVREHGGPACGALVELLLNSGADVDAKVVSEAADLNGLRALHILARWSNDADEECKAKIFQNPFVGKAVSMSAGDHVKVMAFNAARLDLIAAAKGELSLRSASGALDEQGLDDDLSKSPAHVYAYCQQECGWNEEVDSCIQHLRVARMLLGLRADPNAEGPGLESPLFYAVRAANAAYADLLLRAGANPEQQRLDGARPLDIAGHDGQARVGWTLLCHGAQAVPMWELEGARSSLPHVRPATLSMMPRMLVCNAVQCEDPPWNVRFLERLLADWAPVDEVWEETGETALQMAIGYQDPDMVRILVMAGADVGIHPNAKEQGPAASQVLFKGAGVYELEMLQTLLDAGADIHEWVDPNTDYDLLQSAANHGDVEAVIKLVEAGANWKLPVGQRVVGGSIFYVPEILTVHVPHLKLSYIEGRMKLAEKAGRQRRAAIATALEPWLPANINPECKEATLKTLIAASVVPGRPTLHRRSRVSSVRPVAGSSWRQSARAPAATSSIAIVEEEDKEEPEQKELDDIDALLAELESDEDKGASSSKAGGKKKKKKETAAQREAKKQQKLRAMRLQQQQQQQRGSSSDSEAAEVADSNSREGPAAADEQQALDAAADMQQGAAAEAASEQAEQADKQLLDQQQQQVEPEQSHKQQKKSKKAKAAQQQQQQHLHSRLSRASRAETGAAEQQAAEPAEQLDHSTPAPQQQQQEQQQEQKQPLPPSRQQPPAPLQREQQQKQQQQQMDMLQPVAKAAGGGSGVVVHAQQVAPLPAAAFAAAAAAGSSSSGGGAGGSPVQVPAARAFLPPHLRMSMPGVASSTPLPPPAAAAVAAAGAATVQQPHMPTVQQPHMMQQQQQAPQQVTSPTEHAAAGMRQRMVELAKQHQLQQQQQQAPSPPPPLVSPRQQQQQQQQPAKGAGPPLPALPHAMMALLSGSQQAAGPGPAQHGTSTTTAAGPGNAAVALQHSRAVGSKRQAPAAASPTPGRAQQVPTPTAAAAAGGGGAGGADSAGPRDKPAAGQRPTSAPAGGAAVAGGAAGSADAAGAKGPKLCVVCSERRRNVLLIPCNHLVLCEQCADRLDGQGGLSSCPLCSKPCKQRIRVHQS